MKSPGYTANRDKVVREFVANALHSKFWIYHPATKTWYTPEDFQLDYTQGKLNLTDDWMQRFKIINPLKGIAAADTIVNEIMDKRSAFVSKLTEYFQKK